MDSAKGNGIKKITAKKTGWPKRMDKDVENMEVGSFNGEQEKIIEELEEVLTFLKSVHVKNEEALVHIKKPLDVMKSSLKYLPTGPSFNDLLPTEIKDNIFSRLCDSNAFIAASVCQEWKEVIKSRFNERKVTIGKNCCDCEDNDYIEPAEMLKASATHKMDVHLFIGHPITEVDSKLVTDALTSVSKFTISGLCDDYDDSDDSFDSSVKNTILSTGQWNDLMEGLEKRDKVMEKIELFDLDLNNLNQERLASCLVNKVKKLTLDEGVYGGMLDAGAFITKLRGSTDGNLSHLTLHSLDLDSEDSCFDLADALCNVENVKLAREFHDIESFEFAMLKRLIINVVSCTRPITMKTLIIGVFTDFELLISPENMRNLFNRMATFQLWGTFTSNQLEAVKSLPDVTISRELAQTCFRITKGSSEIF